MTALCVLPGYRRDAPEPRNAELRQYGTLLSEHYRYCRCFCVRLILRDRDYERLPKFGTTQPYYRYSQWNKTTEVWRPRVAKLAKPPEVATVDGDGMGWSLMSTMKQHETPENMEQQQLAQPSASFILPCRNRLGGCAVADVARHGKGRGWQGKLRNISKKRTDSHGFLWISMDFYCIFFLMDFHTFITFFYPVRFGSAR